ncbi:(Fe-S)-binding protein [Methanosalsum natronophilum]|uniref:(Fe-S)-binding protein n=1 Tax=Methanosalsum natronophilum TaxID=768733 RepID=UPI00216A61EF|nr:(Fe-S)-binding protein [Methanosalsum natronophilum]
MDCGKCHDACSVFMVTGNEDYTPQAKINVLSKIEAGEELSQHELDNIYLSTRCGACDDICPVNIPITQIIQYERELLGKRDLEPTKTSHISNNIMNKGSPGGMDRSARFDWVTEDLEIAENADLAYMAGCWVSYSQPQIAQCTIKLLNHAGIDVQILKDETCCGLFLIDNGNIEKATENASKYLEYLETQNIKRLLTSCPGCYHVIKNEYKKLGLNPSFEVVYALDLLKELIDDNIIVPKRPLDYNVSVRDACPIRDKKDVPRSILRSIGVNIKEMFNGQQVCCGGPAGLKPNFPKIAGDIALLSVNEYKKKADTLVSYCPFCLHHISDVCKSNEGENELEMKDVVELVAESVLDQ